ncbi:MAG: DUF3696 domain-containing protein [Trebonia sp.]
MITGLEIRYFKCFAALQLNLRPLTVLTGVNGGGKSTVLQALLLARQAATRPDDRVVQLNGPYELALGEAHDVLHPDAERPQIDVLVETSDGRHWFIFEVPDDRALNLPVRQRPGNLPPELTSDGVAFSYLTAERLGPRDQLDVTAEETRLVGVGVRGEFTAQALAMHESDQVRAELRHPLTSEHGVTTLRTQVENWASSIIRPIRVTAQWPAGITASLIRFQEPELIGQQVIASEPIKPANMGFGVSYALPILVAGLMVPESGVLVVENPEAHLHPAGQSRLGRFLARVAGSGVQVIIETHSEHIINGIRLAAVEDRVISSEAIMVHFFGDGPERKPATIAITGRGSLSSWPRGFFDQAEDDLGRIARANRRNG